VDAKDISVIGVVGCGLMGAGIAETCARAGFDVIVSEVNDELLQRGLKRVTGSLSKACDKGKLSAGEMAAAASRLRGTVGLAELSGCDLVVDAAIENVAAKQSIFAELDRLLPEQAIIASNTSSLSITQMAGATGRPDRVLGMHFFNPVPVMPLLELVRGLLTADETVATARALGERLGKTVVVAKDRPGFIGNLLFVPYALDAVRWFDAGLATKEEIDAAMRLGFNHPMGPLALIDLVGIDTLLFIADAMHEEFKDSRYAAPPLLRRMFQAGLLGRKSGRGFYDYPSR
jgi:3-hydroxybutyryl-CoA dehydrogenase